MKNQNENATVSDVTARMREEASILSLLNGQSVGVASVVKKLHEFADSIDAAVSKTETTDALRKRGTTMMQTIGEQGYATVMESQLRRIADALEAMLIRLDALGMTKVYNSPSIYDEMKERAMKGEQE